MAASPDFRAVRAFVAGHYRALVVGCLVVFAAVVRMIEITEVPKGFFTDEASFGLNADLILHTARDEHGVFLPVLFKSFGEYKLPIFIYAEVPFMAIFGRTEEAVRLTSAVLGALTIGTTYLLAKELFKHELPAFAAAAFLAISPWHIHYSRTGLGDIVSLPLFFTLGFYLFFRAMRDWRFLMPAALVLALTFYCYRGGWLVLPPLLLFLAIAYRRELYAMREITLAAGLVFAAALAPLAYHLLFSDADRSSQAWIFNLDDNRGTFDIFSDFYRSYFTRSFLFENGDNSVFLRHFLKGQGELYYIQAPLLLLGIVGMLARRNRRYLFVLVLLFAYPLTASVSDTSPISSRSILGSVAFALISGAGVGFVADLLMRYLPSPARLYAAGAAVAVIAVVALFGFAGYQQRYYDNYARQSDGFWGWQDGPQEIVGYFLQVEDSYDDLYMSGNFNAPSIFFRFYAGDGGCPKCGLGSYRDYDPGRRQLFALKPEELKSAPSPYQILHTINYEDGSIAFQFVVFSGPSLQAVDDAR